MVAQTIYDFGMNNGDDVEYYLLKSLRVVGVDANPSLCAAVRRRFSNEISTGRLTVLNAALSEKESRDPVTFYVHKTAHVLSQLPKPDISSLEDFETIQVPCRTPASIIREFGEPLYVKIDVEHSDLAVLENIFSNGIFPPEISAEAHSVGIFAALIANGYNSFTFVEGKSVADIYGTTKIKTIEGERTFSFKEHSAGPFGEDIRASWEDGNTFLYTLASAGLGWKDIHASRVIPPAEPPSGGTILMRQFRAVARGISWRLIAWTSSRH